MHDVVDRTGGSDFSRNRSPARTRGQEPSIQPSGPMDSFPASLRRGRNPLACIQCNRQRTKRPPRQRQGGQNRCTGLCPCFLPADRYSSQLHHGHAIGTVTVARGRLCSRPVQRRRLEELQGGGHESWPILSITARHLRQPGLLD